MVDTAAVSITNVHPAHHRPVNGVDNPALQAGIRRYRAAHEPGAKAHAEATPTPVVSTPAVTPCRCGSWRKRNRAKSSGRSENKSHFTEHGSLSFVGLDACFSSSCKSVVRARGRVQGDVSTLLLITAKLLAWRSGRLRRRNQATRAIQGRDPHQAGAGDCGRADQPPCLAGAGKAAGLSLLRPDG